MIKSLKTSTPVRCVLAWTLIIAIISAGWARVKATFWIMIIHTMRNFFHYMLLFMQWYLLMNHAAFWHFICFYAFLMIINFQCLLFNLLHARDDYQILLNLLAGFWVVRLKWVVYANVIVVMFQGEVKCGLMDELIRNYWW